MVDPNDGWIECNLLYRTYDGKPSFEEVAGSLPGLLIEIEYGNKVYLIGHINTLRGTCDDCAEFGPNTIVLRYKRIWDGPDPLL
jgi:hypothetical protein